MEERWEPQVAVKKPETPPSVVSAATELSLDVSSEDDFEGDEEDEEEQPDSDEEAETPVNEEEEEEKVAALLLSYRQTVTSTGGSSASAVKQKFDPERDYTSLLAKASRAPRGAKDAGEKENQTRRAPAPTGKPARAKTASPKAAPVALTNISDRVLNCVSDETQRKQVNRDTFCVRKEESAPECVPVKASSVEPRRQTISVRQMPLCSPIAETNNTRDTRSSGEPNSRDSSFDEDESNAKRPRRGRMVSYKEPPLNRKLRKGDPHTDNFTSSKYSPTKMKPKKAPPTRRVR